MTLHFDFQAFTPLQFQRDSLYVIPSYDWQLLWLCMTTLRVSVTIAVKLLSVRLKCTVVETGVFALTLYIQINGFICLSSAP